MLFFCPTCHAQTQLTLVKSYDLCHFGVCAVCDSPALLAEPNDQTHKIQQLYPIPPGQINITLPGKVEKSYREVKKCAEAGVWLATAVMVRRTLEAIGKEFDPTAKTLFDGLRQMRDNGVISEEMWQWGDALRFIGNIGAHPTDDDVSAQDGKEAIEFLDAIIEIIYHLRPKFQAMLSRRKGNAPLSV